MNVYYIRDEANRQTLVAIAVCYISVVVAVFFLLLFRAIAKRSIAHGYYIQVGSIFSFGFSWKYNVMEWIFVLLLVAVAFKSYY